MLFALITFSLSLVCMVIMIMLKMFVFDDKHIHVWVRVRNNTDRLIHTVGRWVRDWFIDLQHMGLRKILSVLYHRFIPFIENQYRKAAGSMYRLHRKLSRVFEYSKSTTRNVSEHLHHLTEAKKQKEGQDK